MSDLKIGSLFSGYGGLDMAVESVTGAKTAWVSDIDKGACKILAHRYPDIPNHGDLTTIDWSAVESVDIITGGFPCQDLSHAGKGAGMTSESRSGLWSYMRDAINIIRPRLVVAENVRGLLSAEALRPVEPCTWCVGDEPDLDMRALGAVLADLADIGYDASWYGLRAADVGACHGRWRCFVVAYPNSSGHRGIGRLQPIERDADGRGREDGPGATGERSAPLPTPRTSDTYGAGAHGEGGVDLRTAVTLLPTPAAQEPGGTVDQYHARLAAHDGRDSTFAPLSMAVQLLPTPQAGDGEKGGPNQRGSSGDFMLPSAVHRLMPTPKASDGLHPGIVTIKPGQTVHLSAAAHNDFGQYGAAIARWESVLGRPSPSPTDPSGKGGAHRLSAKFTEWMMGLPDGWITDVPGITRNEELKACGNGVVPQQAAAALRRLLAVSEVAS